MKSQHKFLIHALLAAFLFGLSTPASKLLLNQEISPVLLAAIFYISAAVFLIPFSGQKIRNEIKELIKNRTDQYRMLGAIICGGIAGPILLLYGIKYSHPSTASLLLNLETVATTLLALLLFKEHISKKVAISSLLTVIAGSLLMFNQTNHIAWGSILIALACLCWGMDNNLTATIQTLSPRTNTIIKSLVAGCFNLLIAAGIHATTINITHLLGGLVIGFFAYGLSIMLYITAARQLGATRSQIIFASNPFLACLISSIVFSTDLDMRFWIALTLMILALVILYYERHGHLHYHPSEHHIHEHDHTDGHHQHLHSAESESTNHSHYHTHQELHHSHGHYPDQHHRHKH